MFCSNDRVFAAAGRVLSATTQHWLSDVQETEHHSMGVGEGGARAGPGDGAVVRGEVCVAFVGVREHVMACLCGCDAIAAGGKVQRLIRDGWKATPGTREIVRLDDRASTSIVHGCGALPVQARYFYPSDQSLTRRRPVY